MEHWQQQATPEQDQQLIKAAEAGDLAKVKDLISKGANVNAKDEEGYTALILAAGFGHIEIARLLIDKGADVNAKTNDGHNALIAAEDGGHPEIVKLLKAAEAKG